MESTNTFKNAHAAKRNVSSVPSEHVGNLDEVPDTEVSSPTLECIRFLEYVIGVEVHKHAASSVWVKGMLRSALANRKQRKQSRPLRVAELNYLERFLADEGNSLQDRSAIGCCLFAIYS